MSENPYQNMTPDVLTKLTQGCGIDSALAASVEAACKQYHIGFEGSEWFEDVGCVVQIFAKGFADRNDLLQVIEFFPGLIIEPAALAKETLLSGPVNLDTVVDRFRLDTPEK